MCCSTCATAPWCAPGRCQPEPLLREDKRTARPFGANWVRVHNARWPKRLESRDAVLALYRGYGDSSVLHRADGLVVHRCDDGRVVVIEPEVHGRVVGSGAGSENRFVTIVTGEDRKVVHWRDYMDALSASTKA